ncbi:S1 family peptidase [Luteipulveratus mongoliensis]|uniref:Serine protease n=1 Tax=Luteipulveratus mongoliensis TaxID=571913 RepID=A0A0K1JL59_9MICO|nr:serine protease [Luteipulveratus mongoliensis]AKU17305.1 hypothetical protein VV02_18025 [Luteipulveratus mongoliensis]
MTTRSLRTASALGVLCAATTLATALAPAATAARTPRPTTVAADSLESTIALNNCSASLVRYPTSVGSDRALMLTNGHCYEGGFIDAGVVLRNKASSRSGTLLDAAGNSSGTVKADTLLYGTMTGNDVALYQLTETFDAIKNRTSRSPLTISGSHPVDGTSIAVESGYWKRVWNCSISGFVPTVREGDWTWHDSVRYSSSGCDVIGGSSGSPVVNTSTGEVVAINNTINENGEMCTVNNPCEVDESGHTTATKGRGYAQETYWFTTCLTSARVIDLTVAGCKLTGATTEPPPTGANLLKNPGFESGAVNWTGTSGPITNDSGRPAHSGTWKAWLGGNGRTSSENVSQSVTIPATATAPKLSYWIRSDTNETGSTVYDTLKVQVVSGTSTTTLATHSNVGTSSTYTQKTIDLSAYKGKTITLKYAATEDSSLQTSFVIDDTSVTVG